MIRIEDEFLKFDLHDIYIDKKRNLPKKITGHSFVALIGKDKFKTKGDCVIELLKILQPKQIDEFYQIRGAYGEKLIERMYLRDHRQYCTYEKKDINYDNFPDIKYFGGLVDGLLDGATVVECKSKSLSDKEFVINNKIESEELQGEYYATLWNLNSVFMEYVFFPSEIEEKIKRKEKIDSFKGCERHQKPLIVDNQKIIQYMKEALSYYMNCYSTFSIPISDISNAYMDRLIKEKGLQI